jgi:hypothetical protein
MVTNLFSKAPKSWRDNRDHSSSALAEARMADKNHFFFKETRLQNSYSSTELSERWTACW